MKERARDYLAWRWRNVRRHVGRFAYFGYRRVVNPIYRWTDSLQLTSPDSVYSDEYYAKRQGGAHARDAERFAAALVDVFDPDSVVDFGCAIGHYLRPLYDRGITVHGVDAHPSAMDHRVIPEACMELADLRERYDAGERFDVAMCIEVAEHLAPRYAAVLVDSLVDAAPVVVFTAAPPGQGGTHHVNERPRGYWKRLFRERGYRYDADAVAAMRERVDPESLDHVVGNLFVFRGAP